MHELGTQLFVGNARPIPELLKPVENGDGQHSIFVKPIGGLWTSTWHAARQLSGWVEWCDSEDFGDVRTLSWWLVSPKPKLRIAVIDSLADLQKFLRRYPRPMDARLAFLDGTYLDYARMGQDYDALHLTEEGQWRTRLTVPANLYGWDCESTLWFHWSFTDVQQIELSEVST